jgi:1,4-alpha-glucan branching enzyme
MLYKMPGDEWQKFANLRTLYTYMYTHPGAKLLFMGNEFGATTEWNYKSELPWELLQFPSHEGMKRCVQQLNALYRNEPALYEKQFEPGGFDWIDLNHRSESVIAYMRKGKKEKDSVLVVLNLTPMVRHDWELYVHGKGKWAEIFNSDSKTFWGTGDVFNPEVRIELVDKPSKCYRLTLNLPALGAIVLR